VQERLDKALNAPDLAGALIRQDGDDALQTQLHCRRGDILFALGRAEECLTEIHSANYRCSNKFDPTPWIPALPEFRKMPFMDEHRAGCTAHPAPFNISRRPAV
jgi:hypothetical protein